MAATKVLKTPTNAVPVQTDEFPGSATGTLRKILVSEATASLLVTVVNTSGVPMDFKIQGVGNDEDAVGESMQFFVKDKWSPSNDGNSMRAAQKPQAWTFCVSGNDPDPVIQVMSGFFGGGGG